MKDTVRAFGAPSLTSRTSVGEKVKRESLVFGSKSGVIAGHARQHLQKTARILGFPLLFGLSYHIPAS